MVVFPKRTLSSGLKVGNYDGGGRGASSLSCGVEVDGDLKFRGSENVGKRRPKSGKV